MVLQQHKNTSLDFVKTVGALYFQKKNNKNLAQKIIAHFLDKVRSRYNISTTSLDEEFVQRLSSKSGLNETKVRELISVFNKIQQSDSVSDAQLTHLYQLTDEFNKKS